mmetsp:Transcript_34166/g.78884  ORF Transcript_34166/g.78884 Transcript_34166/m.78884 type:complete len:522 (-) Transcript_34166:320-1885(-)
MGTISSKNDCQPTTISADYQKKEEYLHRIHDSEKKMGYSRAINNTEVPASRPPIIEKNVFSRNSLIIEEAFASTQPFELKDIHLTRKSFESDRLLTRSSLTTEDTLTSRSCISENTFTDTSETKAALDPPRDLYHSLSFPAANQEDCAGTYRNQESDEKVCISSTESCRTPETSISSFSSTPQSQNESIHDKRGCLYSNCKITSICTLVRNKTKHTLYENIDHVQSNINRNDIRPLPPFSSPDKPAANTESKRLVSHTYTDFSLQLPTLVQRNGRGSCSSQFPEKLYSMLDQADHEGFADVLSWKIHGRAFRVYKQDKFVNTILKKHFKQSKWTSFQRQLNIYGFKRLTRGSDMGCYYHECFLRGIPELCSSIKRMEVKGTESRALINPSEEPNFYTMSYVGQKKQDIDMHHPRHYNNKKKDKLNVGVTHGRKRKNFFFKSENNLTETSSIKRLFKSSSNEEIKKKNSKSSEMIEKSSKLDLWTNCQTLFRVSSAHDIDGYSNSTNHIDAVEEILNNTLAE